MSHITYNEECYNRIVETIMDSINNNSGDLSNEERLEVLEKLQNKIEEKIEDVREYIDMDENGESEEENLNESDGWYIEQEDGATMKRMQEELRKYN